jgi:hypothetical protein
MTTKELLTQQLVNLLPTHIKITEQDAMVTWWYNIRRDGGLRLTPLGFHVLKNDLELENFVYLIDNPTMWSKKLLLDLDRKMRFPYFIEKGTRIYFFSGKEAMMINLYGDLKSWLKNYESRPRES